MPGTSLTNWARFQEHGKMCPSQRVAVCKMFLTCTGQILCWRPRTLHSSSFHMLLSIATNLQELRKHTNPFLMAQENRFNTFDTIQRNIATYFTDVIKPIGIALSGTRFAK